MGFLRWFFGGLNFEETKKGKVGDIIYPANNKTNGWCKTSRWDLVVKVNKKGEILHRHYIWDYATVRALELIKVLKGVGYDFVSQGDGE